MKGNKPRGQCLTKEMASQSVLLLCKLQRLQEEMDLHGRSVSERHSLPWSSGCLRHLIGIQSQQLSVCALCEHQPPRRLAAAGLSVDMNLMQIHLRPSAASFLPQLSDKLVFYNST